jgi:hypothetical protein
VLCAVTVLCLCRCCEQSSVLAGTVPSKSPDILCISHAPSHHDSHSVHHGRTTAYPQHARGEFRKYVSFGRSNCYIISDNTPTKVHTMDHKKYLFLGALAKLRKATISFVMSVCPSEWNNSAQTKRVFMKFDT